MRWGILIERPGKEPIRVPPIYASRPRATEAAARGDAATPDVKATVYEEEGDPERLPRDIEQLAIAVFDRDGVEAARDVLTAAIAARPLWLDGEGKVLCRWGLKVGGPAFGPGTSIPWSFALRRVALAAASHLAAQLRESVLEGVEPHKRARMMKAAASTRVMVGLEAGVPWVSGLVPVLLRIPWEGCAPYMVEPVADVVVGRLSSPVLLEM